jgi:hypothetical protein
MIVLHAAFSRSAPARAAYCRRVLPAGEQFDRGLFLVFRMRGMSRKEFLALLGDDAADKRTAETATAPRAASRGARAVLDGRRDPGRSGRRSPNGCGQCGFAPAAGKFRFRRGTRGFFEFLDQVYAAASARAVDVLEGR